MTGGGSGTIPRLCPEFNLHARPVLFLNHHNSKAHTPVFGGLSSLVLRIVNVLQELLFRLKKHWLILKVLIRPDMRTKRIIGKSFPCQLINCHSIIIPVYIEELLGQILCITPRIKQVANIFAKILQDS